jgi:nucleotide-binding universal stress UspA family protein
VQPVVVRGKAGPALVQVAHQPDDLLVLGSGERGWPARLFHGRVARYCVAHAACQVLTVPPPALLSALPPLERHRAPHPLLPV